MKVNPDITRPVLRYLGGKFRLAPWIISFLPPHKVYIEPFGGAANVLLRKPRAKVEVYNDLEDDVVNLFRVLREDAQAARLIQQLRLTPFARTEFFAAYEPAADPVERARRMIVRSFMGHGATASRIDRTTGFRAVNTSANADPSKSWSTFPDSLSEAIKRLDGVAIENVPAEELIRTRDGKDVLFYVDPPYVHATRSAKRTRSELAHGYNHELDDAAHVALVEQLNGVDGMVVLSGYDNEIYDAGLVGWERHELPAMADGAQPRTEALWLNPAASEARRRARHQPDLF